MITPKHKNSNNCEDTAYSMKNVNKLFNNPKSLFIQPSSF